VHADGRDARKQLKGFGMGCGCRVRKLRTLQLPDLQLISDISQLHKRAAIQL
jgi:hypothetical protein